MASKQGPSPRQTDSSEFNIPEKVKQYEKFINDNLKQDLTKVHAHRDKLYSTIADYLQLRNTIERIKDFSGGKMKTQVDIGCNFYCQAEVVNTRMILVAIGFGFFVEFTLDEALDFISKKVDSLTKEVEVLTKDSSKIKANIKLAVQGLSELQMLNLAEKKHS